MAEELWESTGHRGSVHEQAWPQWNPELATEEMFTLVVQINGKVRDRIDAPVTIDEEGARDLALASPRVQSHLDGLQVQKVFYREGRLINLVLG